MLGSSCQRKGKSMPYTPSFVQPTLQLEELPTVLLGKGVSLPYSRLVGLRYILLLHFFPHM